MIIMSIKYKMIHRGDYLNPDEQKKTGFYPQVVRASTINIEQLAERMSHGKRLNAIELKSTIQLLMACVEDELLAGNSVCLDGFGTFALTASCLKSVSNPAEVRAESIVVKRVVFTPSKPLKSRLKLAKFERCQ